MNPERLRLVRNLHIAYAMWRRMPWLGAPGWLWSTREWKANANALHAERRVRGVAKVDSQGE